MSDSKPLLLDIRQLGVVEYRETLELQRAHHKNVVNGTPHDTLLVCAHHPVITLGTSTKPEHLYASRELLESSGVPVVDVERGGSVTYHGPEQVVVYPILNLSNHKRDVSWYMRALEEVVIRTSREYGIEGMRIPGKTGVWLDDRHKIAFTGVRISRWCTYHGFSLNVFPVRERFSTIDPCGLGAIEVISLAEVTSDRVSWDEVARKVVAHFIEVFGYSCRLDEISAPGSVAPPSDD